MDTLHSNDVRRVQTKLDVEGSLFVVQRLSAPFHQFVVLNRRSTDNFVEDISTPHFAIQNADPYLMYRRQDEQIIGSCGSLAVGWR
jgi:hypothetical protein